MLVPLQGLLHCLLALLHNDLQALAEVHGLMNEIRQAWRDVPALLPQRTSLTAH